MIPTLLDCSELYRAGFTLPGFYKIDPTGNRSATLGRYAFCENGWTHILRRMPTDQGQVVTKYFLSSYHLKYIQNVARYIKEY